MKTHLQTGMIVVSLVLFQAPAFGQVERPRNTYRATITDTSAKYAPEIRSDRTVTLRMRAPEATKVEVRFGLGGLGTVTPMTRDADGVWRVTLGPLDPEIYTYNFIVNGVAVSDASNPLMDIGRSSNRSIVEIPGAPARFDERQEVPHGALHVREYMSSVVTMRRRVFVYAPPQYDSEPARRFPVLYLRHGNGDLESAWSGLGRAGDILDNLLAQRKALPMLIVMPNGYPSADGEGSSTTGVEITSRELLNEIIPLIEKHYRVIPNRDNRAIAGLSMGATQAFTTGLGNLDTFSWVAAFSSGAIGDADFKLERVIPGSFANASARPNLRLLFLSCGAEDPRYAGHLDLVDRLKGSDIPFVWYSTAGAHDWRVWRHSLADLLPRLFQTRAQ